MAQYIQTTKILWKASICAQDGLGNTTERGFKVYASSLLEAAQTAAEHAEEMAAAEGWERWMLYDIGIVPDDCFN